MTILEWNNLQRGDVLRYKRIGKLIRVKPADRTVIKVRVSSYGSRYISFSNLKGKGLVEYPQAACKSFSLIRQSTDTARSEMKRVTEESLEDKLQELKSIEVEPPKIEPQKEITVRFSISGITPDPIKAEFAIDAPIIKINQ